MLFPLIIISIVVIIALFTITVKNIDMDLMRLLFAMAFIVGFMWMMYQVAEIRKDVREIKTILKESK